MSLKLLKFLPKNHLSFWAGKAMHQRLPGPLARMAIARFAKFYNINTDEAEKPIDQYRSVGDFFVRRLKPDARPLGAAPVVHPADAVLSQFAPIDAGQMIQAKGKTFSVHEFVADAKAEETYKHGYFATYYLCPTDYHRVHSPVTGRITRITHVPGKLWPVHAGSVQAIDNLFSVNERVILTLETDFGPCEVVFVGATNVGKISLAFEPELISNNLKHRKTRHWNYAKALPVEKGQELGQFNMGSTVVVVYSAGFRTKLPLVQAASLLGSSTRVRADFV